MSELNQLIPMRGSDTLPTFEPYGGLEHMRLPNTYATRDLLISVLSALSVVSNYPILMGPHDQKTLVRATQQASGPRFGPDCAD